MLIPAVRLSSVELELKFNKVPKVEIRVLSPPTIAKPHVGGRLSNFRGQSIQAILVFYKLLVYFER